MILKLPFKKAWYYRERPIEIILRIGTLEDLCERLNIGFWQIKQYMIDHDFDYCTALLWHGYITALTENYKATKRRKYQTPRYTLSDAAIWYEYMSTTEKKKFIQEMTVLFGKMIEAYKPIGKKKVTTKQSGTISEVLPSES